MALIKIKTPKGERLIGSGQPVFIVAEMSGNHHQNFKEAMALIDAAVEAGVDAVKIQTYTPDTITIDCDKEYFQVKANKAWCGQTLYQLYQKAYTPWEWQPKLKEYAESKGLLLFSTPFDLTAVDFLEKIGVSVYKVASFEIIDVPLLEKIGQTGKPVIISRGMASIEDIELAIKTLKDNGTPEIAVLHCVSSYPALPQDMNLATIPDITERFNTVSGLSDHTLGSETAVAAVALGAGIIEKHFILSRMTGGPDAGFSLEPGELKKLVNVVRKTERMIGRPNYRAVDSEKENVIFRKSLFAVEDIKKGEIFTPENMRSIRPGHGLKPKYYKRVLGQKAEVDIEKGTPLKMALIENSMDLKYIVRPARKEDAEKIWKIRNQPVCRQNSMNPEPISLEDHLSWFENKYFGGQPNFCFVLADDDRMAGYCRFDFDVEKDSYVISIAVDCDCHGRGFGHELLSRSLDEFSSENDKPILAEIKKMNLPSIKIFKKNDFIIYLEDADNYYLKYERKQDIRR